MTTELKMKVGLPAGNFVYGNGRSNLDYDSDDEPLLPPLYDSDDEPLMRYSTPKEDGYDSDDEPLIKSVGRPKKKIINMTEADFRAEMEMEDGYDSDDEPLMRYSTPKQNDDDDDDDKPLMPPQRKHRWNMIKKCCKKKTASEKWRDMRSVINISKRKEKQQRVKILMDKYGFKIKSYYNMNKKMLEKEFARALWK